MLKAVLTFSMWLHYNRSGRINSFTFIIVVYLTTYSSPNVLRMITLRRMRWVGRTVRMLAMSTAYRNFSGKFLWKRPRGRTECKCQDNIQKDLWYVGCESGDSVAFSDRFLWIWQWTIDRLSDCQILNWDCAPGTTIQLILVTLI